MKNRIILYSFILLVMLAASVVGNNTDAIDPAALIERILTVDSEQRSRINDIVFDTEFIEKNKDGTIKARFTKKTYLKYLPDTVLYHEQHLEYYKDDKLQSEKDRDNQAKERKEKAIKRKARNISNSMFTPFFAENADKYEITYEGVVTEEITGFVCHHFKVQAVEESADHINGDYYFEAESFHLVQVDFSPAKLVRKTMFKLYELNISVTYGATAEGYWLPQQADISGRGKAMFIIGVNFASTEYYRNPVINGGVDDEIFTGENDE
ncbi:MAG: hypothetical protein KAT79_01235 [candidate division Zixibacteria bacterium]|nr:hypothetical protein [candidate division Zixibacteria bacterium]